MVSVLRVVAMAALSSSEKSAHTKSTLSPECLAVRQQLDAYVDGEVSETEAAEVVAHVDDCPLCYQAEADLRNFLASVSHSQLPVLASRRLRLRIAQLFASQHAGERRDSIGDR